MFAGDADPALVEWITNDMCDGSPEVGTALIADFLDYDMGSALAAVADVPLVYINSDQYPTDSEANQKYHPTFSGATVQDVGHFLMMEEPYVFNDLLRQVVDGLNQEQKCPPHPSRRNRSNCGARSGSRSGLRE